jgi:5'-nucleotidase
LIADAQLAATRDAGAQIAFTNPGGIRAELVFHPPDGTVSFQDAYRAQPFGNTLLTMTLTGEQLRRLLEQQSGASSPERTRLLQPSAGFEYRWDPSQPRGSRVVPQSMKLHGVALRPEASYRVTVNSFLAEGGDGFRVLRDGTERRGGVLDVDALVSYLQARSAERPLLPDTRPRIVPVRSPAPAMQ